MKIKLYAAVAALVLMPATAAAAAPPSEWSQTGYGPGNTYYNPDESRLNAQTVGGVRQRWTLATHSTSLCEVGVAPVVSGGRLFTSDPGGIGGYDPATGARKWHVDLPRTSVRRLAVADGKLLMLSSTCNVGSMFESFLTAYDPGDGARLWSRGLAKFSYDMRVDRGVVALDSNQDGLASTIAYRVTDGLRLWLRKGDRGDGLVSAGGRLLLRRANGGAVAVSIADGRVLWQTKRNWYAAGSSPDGSRFYLAGNGLSAVDAATGRVFWTANWTTGDVTADRRHLYFIRERSVECLDAATGRKLWSIHLPRAGGRPVRAGGLLYTPNGTGSPLSIADAATGKPRPATAIRSYQDHPPVVAGGRLFVTDGSELRAYY
ncbi:outer membrane protein assembly factor BamB family protein [Paractinoplanes rishiriensis]|uniref:Pyrrolo-quinoline quinone repeat domain-containing protein n=1 Tax=Paractinoplanes rishiriensis TaxID=1050105 RepID=A0A919K343_9ACTN|nr:PQQ-binding-like beta-propeller repeat protein [Actinoplanes rishiriensis]GIE97977.1 hypothetical protein Ari01nite_54420 [Actinoplanes rishiriensis]